MLPHGSKTVCPLCNRVEKEGVEVMMFILFNHPLDSDCHWDLRQWTPSLDSKFKGFIVMYRVSTMKYCMTRSLVTVVLFQIHCVTEIGNRNAYVSTPRVPHPMLPSSHCSCFGQVSCFCHTQSESESERELKYISWSR